MDDRAALNRKIVSEKLYTSAYEEVERALTGLPFGEIPPWMTVNNIISVNLKELKKLAEKHRLIGE